MGLTVRQAWQKAAKLMARASGYGSHGDVSVRKVKESFNDVLGIHVMTFELVIKNKISTPIGKPLGEDTKPSFIQSLLADSEA